MRGFGVEGNFSAKPGEFFVSQRRDDIVATSYGDAIGGLYRVATLQPAHVSYPPAQQGIAVAERVFLVLLKAWYRMLARRHCRRSPQEIKCYLRYGGHVSRRQPAD